MWQKKYVHIHIWKYISYSIKCSGSNHVTSLDFSSCVLVFYFVLFLNAMLMKQNVQCMLFSLPKWKLIKFHTSEITVAFFTCFKYSLWCVDAIDNSEEDGALIRYVGQPHERMKGTWVVRINSMKPSKGDFKYYRKFPNNEYRWMWN